MSAIAWDRIRPGDVVVVRNRFIDVTRAVTASTRLSAPRVGFIDDNGQTFTDEGYAIAVGLEPTTESSARDILRAIATASRADRAA